ncbi:hypothetical protein PMI16_04837 [Herbaspirillum sp. CF444]|uniref:DUF5677 domain-containing protein n=1 Tax=Herbaspirillum sp. CF444 TaxID=1144319 RepID=UPI00027246A1|nr:DUF5677 domain-containing protein [Herbaspirillum sp. CF444]EJL81231.1 hypothetical protein PMI16_04837 [Herbaspirillum sp. CF444]
MNLDQLTSEYSDGLTALFNAVQGSVDEFQEFEPWRGDTHSLALKMFRHLESVKVLCQIYVDLPPGHPPSYYIDFSSAQIVTRAAIETFLTFAYIFGQEDLTLSKFRCEIWQLSGLADRQKLRPGTSADKLKLASEKRDMEQLQISIKSSPHLNAFYTEKQAQRILSGGWSQLRDWKVLAIDAGIHPRYFDSTYSHLSGFSHSSYISAIQISQARNMQTQSDMARFCVQICLFYMTHFLVKFSQISSTAKQFLNNDTAAISLIQKWHISSDDWNKLYSEKDLADNDFEF